MPTEPLLRTSEAATVLGVSHETLRRWVADGKIRHVKLPSGQMRFRRSDLLDVLTPVEPVGEASA